jgi:exodeoxyribonuclease VII large subunit
MPEGFFEFRQRITRRVEVAAVPAPARAGGADKTLTVSELTHQIDRALRTSLPQSVLVRGEVSNFSAHGPSGHFYFTLKDTGACIDCVMFRSDAARVKFKLADGMEMLASGQVKVYAQRGRYQLYVTRLEPLGQGALELAFQQLRAKLEREGLFERERKKPLPRFPQRIALVTAQQAAALQDMLKVLQRFGWLKLMLYPVPVQGEGAGTKIAMAIGDLNRRASSANIDVILLSRGGGSLEDLWAFNEEAVARAIADSRIPIVTGIGHEVDVSIADLVADYHAHTPTEAAQVVTSSWRGIDLEIDELRLRLDRLARDQLARGRQRLDAMVRHEFFRRPMDLVNSLRQVLDDRQRQLHHLTLQRLNSARAALSRCETAMASRHPHHLLRLARQKLDSAQERLRWAGAVDRRRWSARVDAIERALGALSPQAVLERGFSMTTLKNGTIVRSRSQIAGGQKIVTRVADGTFESIAEDPNQPGLFE